MNIEDFKNDVYKANSILEDGVSFSTNNLIEEKNFKYLLLDLSAVNYIDTSAITTLLEV